MGQLLSTAKTGPLLNKGEPVLSENAAALRSLAGVSGRSQPKSERPNLAHPTLRALLRTNTARLLDFWFFPKKAGELLRTELLRGVFRFLPRTLHPAQKQPTPANFGLTEQYCAPDILLVRRPIFLASQKAIVQGRQFSDHLFDPLSQRLPEQSLELWQLL